MPTDTIKCPACGQEVSQDVENCPSCGAPVSVLFNNDISGAPIDNSAAIDAMLRSASQFMEESEALGLDDLDIFNEDEEDDEEEEEETVFKKVTLHELPPELSDEQKDGITSGGVINLSSNGGAPAPNPVQVPDYTPSAPKPAGSLPDDLPDFSSAPQQDDGFLDLTAHENGSDQSSAASVPTPAAPAVSAAPSAQAAPAAENKDKKEKKEKKSRKEKKSKAEPPTLYEVDENGNPVKEKPKKEKKEKEKKPKAEKSKPEKGKSSPLTVLVAAVVALAIGIGGGYFGKMFLFPDLPVPECQEFAQNSVNAVSKKIPSDMQMYIAEAYVNEGSYSTQCIFRAFTQSGESVVSRWFRVKVDHDNENLYNVFFELNNDEYERLRNSEISDERARAAVLRSYQNELERCISEAGGGNGWHSANVSLLNSRLHPYKDLSAETEAPEESSAAQESE